MAKGQVRGNKEAKKPKQVKQPAIPTSGGFVNMPKTIQPHKGKA